MVACQLNMSSPTGPAEQLAGGSFPRSANSFWMRFSAMDPAQLLGFSALIYQLQHLWAKSARIYFACQCLFRSTVFLLYKKGFASRHATLQQVFLWVQNSTCASACIFMIESSPSSTNKKLLVTKDIATRSKDATSSSWHPN